MDSGFELKLENPRQKANPISKLFFSWMVKLCYKGTKKGLEVGDLYRTSIVDSSELLTNKLEQHWENELSRSKLKYKSPSLLRAIFKTFIWNYMFYGLLLFIQMTVINASQPVVLAYFISLFSNLEQSDPDMKYIIASVLVVQSLLNTFLQHHIEFGQSAIGMRIRIAASSLVYRKILRLNKTSLGQTAAGQVINLLSNDVQRFDLVMIALHYLWLMPIQVCVVTYLIWQQVGISSLAGVISMLILTVPGQGYLGKLTSKLRLQVAERTDSRVKKMSEIIAGIQVIKMYAWEKSFEKIIKFARKIEIDVLTKASYLRGIYVSCMVFIERATLFFTVICYVLLGNFIKPEQVFSMARFFNLLQLVTAILYPMAITFGAESLVSIKRLQDFLMLDEKPESTIKRQQHEKDVVIENVTASWTPPIETLKGFSLRIPEGKLCAVIGPVGAGKSSLLQLLLGELPPSEGTISIGGQISYASQEPWLFAATVRNNILFGLDYDKNHYRSVVRVCALLKDFEQFPQGDRTMVGERGVSLSGGQRARINLARAVYRDADIYLLDDPLSAVDTHVGRHLFDQCVVNYLNGKTRILVTHQLQYLQKADYIIVVNEGRIEAQGSYDEISQNDLDFSKLLATQNESDEKQEETPEKTSLSRKASVLSTNSVNSESSSYEDAERNDEEMASKNAKPFKDYVWASGNCYSIFGLCVVLLLGQIACSAADYWVTFWTDQESLRRQSIEQIETNLQSNQTQSDPDWYDEFIDTINIDGEFYRLIKTKIAIYIYTIFIVAAIIFTLIRSFVYFTMAMTASKNLHSRMFHSLLAAPMRFFDTNPSGRVLNRFSKDMGAIDELLPRVLLDAIQILLVMSGILVMVVVANYYMVVAMVILGGLFLKVRSWYILTAKDVKHLEGITKSPVFSHVNSSLYGITTIRASQAEKILMKQFDQHQDVHTAAWFLTIASRVCYGLWLDLISVGFVAVVIFGFIILELYGHVSSSLVGLAISQSLILTGMLQYGMRQTAEVINQLTSVERVMQYTKLEDERALIQSPQDGKLNKKWPCEGGIIFKNLSLRYSPNDEPVLKCLNIEISPGTKVGIVGRTGAGKSSLISALFRLAPIEGSIYIDGIDTKSVSLEYLRKRISIIPQEPVLFSATLRYNLDPFDEFDDKSLWNALEEVELRDSVDSLNYMIMEGGSNFSVGQRQLVCLARAILRNNKILILDEATANVDPRTDTLIQKTIRRKFKHCTVLTIAHRLNTIMDSDKVLVMDAGRSIEFDHPHILLEKPDGHFHKMVLETGPKMTEQLKQISRDVYLATIQEI